jgi:hypothetical protein
MAGDGTEQKWVFLEKHFADPTSKKSKKVYAISNIN